MITRQHRKKTLRLYCTNSNVSSRSRVSSKVVSSRPRRASQQVFRRKSRKAANQLTRAKSKGYMFMQDIGKHIITEIQLSAINCSLLSPPRKVFNEETDKEMEVVDVVMTEEKTPKTVKFEQNLGRSQEKTTKVPKRATRKFHFISKNDKRRSTCTVVSQKNTKNNKTTLGASKLNAYRKCKALGSSQNRQLNPEETSFGSSRPGSVTSLFTACSVGNSMHSRNKNVSTLQQNPCYSDFPKSGLEGHREIVHAIEEKCSFGMTNYSKKTENLNIQDSIHPNRKIFRNMPLITEIESDIEMSKESLKDKSSDSDISTAPPYKTVLKSCPSSDKVPSATITLKCNESTLQSNYASNMKSGSNAVKDFPCFATKNVISFKSIKDPGPMPYNLIKGDDDEDSESEDVTRGKRHLLNDLEGLLVHLKTKRKTKCGKSWHNFI